MSPLKTILCIDDNSDTCELVTLIFQQADFQVTGCNTPKEGICLARTGDFAAIVTDFRLAEMNGVDLCRVIRRFDVETPIIFFTAEARPAYRQAALEAGAQAYLVKPNDFERLKKTVVQIINQSRNEQPQNVQDWAVLEPS